MRSTLGISITALYINIIISLFVNHDKMEDLGIAVSNKQMPIALIGHSVKIKIPEVKLMPAHYWLWECGLLCYNFWIEIFIA